MRHAAYITEALEQSLLLPNGCCLEDEAVRPVYVLEKGPCLSKYTD